MNSAHASMLMVSKIYHQGLRSVQQIVCGKENGNTRKPDANYLYNIISPVYSWSWESWERSHGSVVGHAPKRIEDTKLSGHKVAVAWKELWKQKKQSALQIRWWIDTSLRRFLFRGSRDGQQANSINQQILWIVSTHLSFKTLVTLTMTALFTTLPTQSALQ